MLSSQQLANLWREHSATLLLLARKYGDFAEDCVQEAYIRLAAQTSVPENPSAWLFRVVKNEAVSEMRSEQRRRNRERQAAQPHRHWLEPTATDDPGLNSVELDQALCSLDRDVYDIVVARLWGGLTFRDIAEAFDTSRATACRVYQRGIQQLRDALCAEVDQ